MLRSTLDTANILGLSSFAQKKPQPGKGIQGQNCNVTHCQEPESAHFYNRVTHAWYCRQCATRIEQSAQRDGMSLFDDLKRETPDNRAQ